MTRQKAKAGEVAPEQASPALACTPKMLAPELWVRAADRAAGANPVNHSPIHRILLAAPEFQITAERAALVTTKYHGARGADLTVSFELDRPKDGFDKTCLKVMNLWGARGAAVRFRLTRKGGDVRVVRERGVLASLVGTDIYEADPNAPTMWLGDYTAATAMAELVRGICHETGHTLGLGHEHLRAELVRLIDPQKAYPYYWLTQHWGPELVRQQVLTAFEKRSLRATKYADPYSSLCYQIPGEITFTGQPILGGLKISDLDYQFLGDIYPGRR